MPTGGKIAIHPFTLSGLVSLGQNITPSHSDVVLSERVPSTFFGFPCEMKGKVFPASTQGEIDDATRFMRDMTQLLAEGKLQGLPSQLADRQGTDGLVESMAQVMVCHR